jgi:FimV-like protein
MLPALVAVGTGVTSGSTMALELGPLEMHSRLGHPLRASIAYVLGPNEAVNTSCVSLKPGNTGFPNILGARVSIANGIISLSGRNPINEPLVSATLVIECPYTPRIHRSYTMFLDLSGDPSAVSTSTTVPAPNIAGPRRTVGARPQPAASQSIAQESSYLVQPGDSLSGIAQRLQGRVVALQPAMTVIFDANPEAFENNDPNRLRAGSLLTIPSLAGADVAPQAAVSAVMPSPGTDTRGSADDHVVNVASVYHGADSRETSQTADQLAPPPVGDSVDTSLDAPEEAVTDSLSPTALDTPVDDSASTNDQEAATDSVPQQTDAAFADLQPGDVVIGRDLVADSAGEASVIPDTTITPQPRQIAGSRIIAAPPTEKGLLSNWLVWLAAGILAGLGAFLAFGQKVRLPFGSTPVGRSDAPTRPQSEHGAPRDAAIAIPESTMSVEEIMPSHGTVDFDLSDDSPTQENLSIDADLFDGTGFAESDDVGANENFSFAATTGLDLELPEGSDQVADTSATDIIAPPERIPDDMIIDSEILPDDEDYDMSVIVDVTKMPNPADVTERDLMAVPVNDDNGQTLISDAYTINDKIDAEMQGSNPFEDDPMADRIDDELAATQALSEEIERAAAELANRSDPSGGTSIEVQLTDLSELDLSSEFEAQNDDFNIDITEKTDVDERTVEMPTRGNKAR